MKITAVISSLRAGGAERVMSILCSTWAADGHHVTLLTFEDDRKAPHYSLHPNIVVRPLSLAGVSHGLANKMFANLYRVKTLRRAFSHAQPDVIVSFIDQVNILTLLAARPLKIPVIASERIDPAQYPIGRLWTILRRWTYPWATAITVQTERAARYFPESLHSRISIIPNPVPQLDAVPEPALTRTRLRVLGMGRLVHQKGFDILIDAFARIAPHHPDWDLVIHGEGPDRPSLENRISSLGTRASLPGITKDPASAMKSADLFVLSSRFEGFPNVLVEAMSQGLPVVATDCPSGPAEIVTNGTNGKLIPVDNVPAMATALSVLMDDATERERLGKAARDAVARFDLPDVANMWYALFDRVTRRHTEP